MHFVAAFHLNVLEGVIDIVLVKSHELYCKVMTVGSCKNIKSFSWFMATGLTMISHNTLIRYKDVLKLGNSFGWMSLSIDSNEQKMA